ATPSATPSFPFTLRPGAADSCVTAPPQSYLLRSGSHGAWAG
ncbi:MAG: murein L,D-transpeptidase, partial [Mesorhizobium sp.]